MSKKNLLNLLMIILLLVLAGCPSDDNEGTFESPTNITSDDGRTETTTDSTNGMDLTGGADSNLTVSIHGTAAGIRILEPATVYAINGAGLILSSTVNSDGSFLLSSQTLTAPYLLLIVPHLSNGLDWHGDLQARIIVSNSNDNIAVNPIFTAVALSIFSQNNSDLFDLAQTVITSTDNNTEAIEELNSLLISISEEELNETLNSIIASWGKTSSGENIFSSSLFDSLNYIPRKTMRGNASADHLFIEALSVKFGNSFLAQSLVENVNASSIDGANLLSDKGFQEGQVFTLYTLNKYQPFSTVSAYSVFEKYLTLSGWIGKKQLTSETAGYLYVQKIQSIVDQLILDEIGLNKSEDEIKAKINIIIAAQDISFP